MAKLIIVIYQDAVVHFKIGLDQEIIKVILPW